MISPFTTHASNQLRAERRAVVSIHGVIGHPFTYNSEQ